MRIAIFRIGGGLAMLCAMLGSLTHTALCAEPVPVPRVVIYSGSVISDAMLEERAVQLGRDPGHAWHLSRSSLVGYVTRRTLLPGQAIPLLAVKAPDLVRAGKPVTLVFDQGRLSITGSGIALQAGASGDRISVQNSESGLLVRGVVSDDGSVRVGD